MREPQHFVGGVRVLDLAKCSAVSAVDGVSVVQGLKTSAAFFSFLRANLVLSSTSPSLSSNSSTVPLDDWYQYAPSPVYESTLFASPNQNPNLPLVSLDGGEKQQQHHHHHHHHHARGIVVPPEMSLEPLQSLDDKAAGLRLVASSVAQMEHRAARVLALNPVCLGMLAAAWAAVYRYWSCHLMSASASASASDWGFILLLLCGATMAYFMTIRYLSRGYGKLAEQMGVSSSWLGEGDFLLGARCAGELVGVLVLRLESRCSSLSSSSSGNRKKSRNSSINLRGGKGVVRAWTTKLGHREKGIGRDLLDAAVRMTKNRCGRDAQVGFAKEHANSAMLLPGVFNGSFRRDEMRAAKALERSLEDWESTKRRKR